MTRNSELDQQLESLVSRVVEEHSPVQVLVRTDSVKRVQDTYEFSLVWNFEEVVPSFQYESGAETVLVGDDRATVHFESEVTNPDYWVVNSVPMIELSRYRPQSAEDVDLDLLPMVLDEVVLDAERLEDIITGSSSNHPPVETINIISSPWRKTTEDTGLHLLVRLNSPHHFQLAGIPSEYRFDHVSYLRVDGEVYPVTIDTTLIDDDFPNRDFLHTSDFLVEHTVVSKYDFLEEIREKDINSIIHRQRSAPGSGERTWQ